ncbi:uncharacterized protein LOC125072211 [Vanessa atalanta]|uniref:uncharacterized protein LOC125072211 n=2 Tax=Vanessa atalanta TaxID=42275 RepID=UPI001FCD0E84|nr:uncharacterized protein LOC125072211 [Vanessa atalanta]
MSENIKDLIKKRGSVKGRLTMFINYSNIEYLIDTDDDVQQFSERQEIEDQFYMILAKAKQIRNRSARNLNAGDDDNDDIRSCISGSSRSSEMVKLTKTNNVKLPTIQLPKFGGRYEDWLEFRDTFVSLIHENQGIVDIQKFHYLRASLEGGAAQNHVQSMFVIEPLKRESALGHRVHKCKSGSCTKCSLKHNTLLHKEIGSSQHVEPPVDKATALSVQMTEPVLLSTAVVYILGSDNQRHEARAVLDSGSQASFMTQRLLHKLNLHCQKTQISVTGINSTITQVNKRCDTIIFSKVSSFQSNISLFVLPNITNLCNNRVIIKDLRISSQYTLADPHYYNPIDIDLLLGADIFWNLILSNQIRLGKNCPVLQETQLGYIISGPTSGLKHNIYKENTGLITCNFIKNDCTDIQEQLAKFWSLEETPYAFKPAYSMEEKLCEKHFVDNFTRMPDGRFSVAIPLKKPETLLGDSYTRALHCFLSLERRLQKQPKLKELYIDFMTEYEQLGHMSVVPNYPVLDTNNLYFLPHHGVLRENSATTKLRAVFNASAPSTTGVSLNDLQMVGPTIQNDLFSILIRFRHYSYVMTADIEKMYRQVLIHQNQRHLQNIIWRDDPSKELSIFQLNTVTYGTASAPFLAVRCLKQLALECEDNLISEIINNDFYVDDLVTGTQSIDNLIKIRDSICEVLSKGYFNLRKIKSNIPDLRDISSNSNTHVNLGRQNSNNTLGLGWISSSDKLCFSHNILSGSQVTKRSVLSTIGQIFDPLGLLTVFVIKAKILLQNLWLLKISWDEPLPLDVAQKWNKFKSDLHFLNDLHLPRCVVCPDLALIELHTFCDASQEAYGACTFVRSISVDGKIMTRLLCAKSKVAPLKPTTIPRLELCGAIVAARLTQKVLEAFRLPVQRRILWSDSSVVLGWLKTPPSKLKLFVKNRVAEIQELTYTFEWRYVPTYDNPADLLTRGINLASINTLDLWWSGPTFLHELECKWPKNNINYKDDLPEIVAHVASTIAIKNNQLIDFHRFSTLTKIKRTMAFALRFVYNCKIHDFNQKLSGPLNTQELDNAFNLLLKQSQIESFPEYKLLYNKQALPNKNNLISLSPFLDETGLLRVGGRLKNSKFDYNKRHPVLISCKHPLTKLIFTFEHLRLFHAAPQLLLSSLRQQFWPIGGRNMAKQIAHKCYKCFRMKAQTINPIMGQLPEQRLDPGYPFQTTGVDYCGPLQAADRKGRGSKTIKVYIAVFVCFTTKALHLELVTDLTKETYIAALRRFIARRSKPSIIFSDNGTQFVGAKNEIQNFLKQESLNLVQYMANEGIDFKFIPAYTPHFGGIWEAGVKSVKYHLLRVLGNARLTFEELYTVLVQIESILNSRPLSPISSDPNDLTPLTPGHFLVGRPLTALPTSSLINVNPNRLQRWELVEQLRQNFWIRWQKEYVSELQQRTKWKTSKGDLKEGTMVVIKDDALPPLKWSLGRVRRVFPGPDGVNRVADIETTKGLTRRAFNKICPLPINEAVETQDFNVGGHVKDQRGTGEMSAPPRSTDELAH